MPLPEQPTLADLQQAVARLTKERGWDERSLAEIYLLFTEEVGELAKEVRYHEGIQRDASRPPSVIQSEFADVLIILLDLANRAGVDLDQAYHAKMAVTAKRQWE
jgi:NTP pyrophosphatase (non-canonical NTP hydrolase)